MKQPISDSLRLATEAIGHVRQVLPFGSVNKKEDEKKPNLDDVVLRVEAANIESTTQSNFLYSLKELDFIASVFSKRQAGNCFGQAIVAFIYLESRGVNVDLCQIPESIHYFLAVNGEVFCDPWYGEAYPIADFARHQVCSRSIEYSKGTRVGFPNLPPFLCATPILTCSTNIPASAKWYSEFTQLSGELQKLHGNILQFPDKPFYRLKRAFVLRSMGHYSVALLDFNSIPSSSSPQLSMEVQRGIQDCNLRLVQSGPYSFFRLNPTKEGCEPPPDSFVNERGITIVPSFK